MAPEEAFEGIGTRGRSFRLGQSIGRNVVALGLRRRYRDDQELKLRSTMPCALAFLAPGTADEAFCATRPAPQDDKEPDPPYFGNACAGGIGGARRPPRSLFVFGVRATGMKQGACGRATQRGRTAAPLPRVSRAPNAHRCEPL